VREGERVRVSNYRIRFDAEHPEQSNAMARIRIPIFPLNTVLFPKMPLPLHVFEERYRRLIEHCVAQKERFGVVLVRDPEERGTEVARVGTMASIQAVQKLEGGRYNVLAVGAERFALLARDTSPEGYDVALVETLDDTPADPQYLTSLVEETRRLFGTFFDMLVRRSGITTLEYELPDDPTELSFVVAAVLQMPVERRQKLLETTNTPERLQEEIAWLQRAVKHLEEAPRGLIARPLDLAKARDEVSRN